MKKACQLQLAGLFCEYNEVTDIFRALYVIELSYFRGGADSYAITM